MAGLDDPQVLDLVTFDPKLDEYALIISAPGPWSVDSQLQADKLLAKLTNYVNFVVDGRFVASHPESVGKRLRIQIDCTYPPGSPAVVVIERVRKIAEASGIRLQVCLLQ